MNAPLDPVELVAPDDRISDAIHRVRAHIPDDIMDRVRRHGGAEIIAMSIAMQRCPFATREQKTHAAVWEAQMRERYGNPKPGWLRRQVSQHLDRRANHPKRIQIEGRGQ